MRLALQTDYALRTLMYLAAHRERSKAADVAQFYGISGAHISKVVNQLARLGYIRTVRGIGGGIELARGAEDISVGEVVIAFEGNMHLLECVAVDDVCVIEAFCQLKRVMREAEQVQADYLSGVSLADVVPSARQLSRVGTLR